MKLYVRFVESESVGVSRWTCDIFQVEDGLRVVGAQFVCHQSVPLTSTSVIHVGRKVNIPGADKAWEYVEIQRSVRFGAWDGPYPGKRVIRCDPGHQSGFVVSDQGAITNVIVPPSGRLGRVSLVSCDSGECRVIVGRTAVPGQMEAGTAKVNSSFVLKRDKPDLERVVDTDEVENSLSPGRSMDVLSCPKEAMMTRLPLPARLRLVMAKKLQLSPVLIDDVFREAEAMQFPVDLDDHYASMIEAFYHGSREDVSPMHLPIACLISRLSPCGYNTLVREFVPLVHLGGCSRLCCNQQTATEDLEGYARLGGQLLPGISNDEIVDRIQELMLDSEWQPQSLHQSVEEWESEIRDEYKRPKEYMEAQMRARGIVLMVDAPEFRMMLKNDEGERFREEAAQVIERLERSVAVTDQQRQMFEARLGATMGQLQMVAGMLDSASQELATADVRGEVDFINSMGKEVIWPGTQKLLSYYYRGMISAFVRKIDGTVLCPREVIASSCGGYWADFRGIPFNPRDLVVHDFYVPRPVIQVQQRYGEPGLLPLMI